MDLGRRHPNPQSVADALATALHRPFVVAWRTGPDAPLSVLGAKVEASEVSALLPALERCAQSGVEHLSDDDGGVWTAMSVEPGEGGSDHTVMTVVLRGDVAEEDFTGLASAVAGSMWAIVGQRNMQESHERLGFILDNTVDIISLMRGDGTVEYVTPSAERVLGWDMDYLTSHRPLDDVHPNDVHVVAEAIALAVDEPGEVKHGRFRARHRDGGWVWLETTAVIAPGRSDVAIVSARDVTREVEVERTVAAEKARYRALLDASPQAIAVHEAGVFVYANDAAIRLLGADDPSDVIGARLSKFSTTSPLVVQERSDALAAGNIVGPFESTIRRLDGTLVELEMASLPTVWEDRPAIQVVAVDVTERRRAAARIEHANLHDPLTGLPNRHLLADRVDQALRRTRRTGERSALFFCDLDHFKVINEALGHTVGDEILIEAAARLRSLIRESDTVARFGGDEFVVLSHDLNADEDAAVLAQRIQIALSEPYEVAGQTMRISVSTGVVQVTGDEQRDELISSADSAMYAAKEGGRNRWVLFDSDLRTRATDRLRIESALHESLETGTGFALHVQPEVDLATGSFVGFEALLRWTGPEGRDVPPDRFLPIAADAGLMHQIGGFVLGSAGRTLASMSSTHPNLWLAVNASAEELEDPGFGKHVEMALAEGGVDPTMLCIELTEQSIMRDPAGVAKVLAPLRNRGVSIAIDDFGTGYSSFAYLARFHPEFIKIDRSFTAEVLTEPTHRAIVEAVVHLAAPLGIITVAEGVETAEQGDILRDLGCQYGQGWHFGRPALPAHFAVGAPQAGASTRD